MNEKFGTVEAESLFESTFGETCVTLYGEGISKETNYNYGFIDGNFITTLGTLTPLWFLINPPTVTVV